MKQIIKNKQCKNDEDFLMQEVKNNNILATCTWSEIYEFIFFIHFIKEPM